jgi:hypothetical protein
MRPNFPSQSAQRLPVLSGCFASCGTFSFPLIRTWTDPSSLTHPESSAGIARTTWPGFRAIDALLANTTFVRRRVFDDCDIAPGQGGLHRSRKALSGQFHREMCGGAAGVIRGTCFHLVQSLNEFPQWPAGCVTVAHRAREAAMHGQQNPQRWPQSLSCQFAN